jgi:hypothetical protein
MTDTHIDALQAVRRLRRALEQAAEALAAPNLELLLGCEPAIEVALAGLPPLESLDPGDRVAVGTELDRVSAALGRCRRLGSGLGDFIRVSLEAQGREVGYGRPAAAYAGHTISERV